MGARKILYLAYSVHCNCSERGGGVTDSIELVFNEFFSTFRLQDWIPVAQIIN